MKDNFVIGVLGGMGTYATIHLFKQYAEIFPAEKEWDRPRILIDNRCTMPSRVRAFLSNENVDELIGQMTESIGNLMNAGATRIVLACNTSHLFLPGVYKNLPGAEEKVVHIIRSCADQVERDGLKRVFLLGTEGTIDSRIYQDILAEKGIECLAPSKDEYTDLRDCIEAVKQDIYTDEVIEKFLNMVNRYEACILGCTELPILYEKTLERAADRVTCARIYDPLRIVLDILHDEYLAQSK
ncbi:MAG: aspartate/glutamate racemase family protein [Lachnospiraceae bacterium]|nr:aspartate/glutamate racemase family protein [Lachnospiraceae bacterium]